MRFGPRLESELTTSASLTFATLFLGLVAGVRPVTVLVEGPVSAVVVELDGNRIGGISGPPWTSEVDFGKDFAPHELVARALDAGGAEMARTRQWINLPRPPAEVEVLLERNALGQATAARLAWASLMGSRPESVSLTFDGRELRLDARRRAALPGYDASTAHVLTARLTFANGVESRNDVVLGGGSSGETGSELTAVPIRSSRPGTPTVDALAARLWKNGAPLKVVAVERGPADVVLVRNLDNHEVAARMRDLSMLRFWGGGTGLEGEDRLRILWPVAREIPDEDRSNVLFETSRVFQGSQASLGFALMNVEYPKASSAPRRFAEAVAVAGLRACSTYSRRAVVLVLGAADRDDSHFTPEAVRVYLERLHVPLYVWSLAPGGGDVPAGAWGPFEPIGRVASFHEAVDRLRKDLASQSIVWVEGRHLPQDVTLVGDGEDFAIAR